MRDESFTFSIQPLWYGLNIIAGLQSRGLECQVKVVSITVRRWLLYSHSFKIVLDTLSIQKTCPNDNGASDPFTYSSISRLCALVNPCSPNIIVAQHRVMAISQPIKLTIN